MANTALRNAFPASTEDQQAPIINNVQQGGNPLCSQESEVHSGLGIALDHTKALRVSRQLKRRR